MSAGAVAVVSAVPEELEPLVRRLQAPGSGRVGDLEFHTGELRGRRVVLAVTGEGGLRAAAALESLLARPGLTGVIGVGVAGGLTADLEAGELVLGDRVLEADGSALAPPDWPASGSPRRPERPRGGTVVTVSKIAGTPAEKRALAARLGLDARSVVDLESAAWARAAAAHDLPWLVLRSVSDRLDEALPLDFDRFRDADGRLSRRRLLVHALPRPRVMAELERLRRRVGLCARRLADATEDLLAR